MTVLFLPALILRSAKASLENDSGVGAVQKTILREAESLWLSTMSARHVYSYDCAVAQVYSLKVE